MLSQWVGLAVVWVVVVTGLFTTMVLDEGWQEGDQTVVQAAGISIMGGMFVTLFPVVSVPLLEIAAPISAFEREMAAAPLVLVGLYVTVIIGRRPYRVLVNSDDATTSKALVQRFCALLGGGIAVAAVVVAFL